MINFYKIFANLFLILLLPNLAYAQKQNSESFIVTEATKQAVSSLKQIKQEISLSSERIAQLKSKVEALRKDQLHLQENINQLRAQKEDIDKQLEQEQICYNKYINDQVKAQLRFEKIKNNFSIIAGSLELAAISAPPILAVNPRDIRDMVRSVDVIALMLPPLQKRLYSYRDSLQDLNETIANSEKQKAKLKQIMQQQLIARKKLELLLQEKIKIEQNSHNEINANLNILNKLSEKANNLQDFLNNITQQKKSQSHIEKQQQMLDVLQQYPAFDQLQGKLLLPIKGEKQPNNKFKLVIKSREAQNILSPCEAIVAYAGKFRSYGNIIILDVGKNYYLILSNLDDVAVQNDILVHKSQILAHIAGDKELSIELRQGNEIIDIINWYPQFKLK